MANLYAKDTITPLYAEQMKKEHNGSNWGSTGARYSGSAVEEVIHARPYIQTALDYGCGKGTLAQAFGHLKWSEYDPGIPGKDSKPSGTFDLVTCTDVLEHIEEDYVRNVLAELAQYTDKVMFLDIACFPTGKTFGEGPYVGQDLHITVKSPEWWEDTVTEVVERYGLKMLESRWLSKLSKGRQKRRIQLVFERF